ncbi:MAG: hypothetical protein U0517_02165 [Candidatus Andersenbacteria bacterium]
MSRRLLYLTIFFGVLFVTGLVWFVISANSRSSAQPAPGPSQLFDSDQDGLSDARETELGSDPNQADTDHDGLTDQQEVDTYTTVPTIVDTDGDGYSDGVEVLGGYNPKGPN